MKSWRRQAAWACLWLCLALTACTTESFLRDELREQPSALRSVPIADPSSVIEGVLQALQAGRMQELLKDLHPEALQRYGQAFILERHAQMTQDLEIQALHFGALKERVEQSSSQQKIFDVPLEYKTAFGPIQSTVRMSFRWDKPSARWTLDWTPEIILPGLDAKARVQREPLKAKRGRILDRHGWPLAEDEEILRLSVIAGQFDRRVIPELNQRLGLAPGTVEQALAQSWVREGTLVPIALRTALEREDFDALSRMQIQWDRVRSRRYPFKEALAPLIGYVSRPTAEDLQDKAHVARDADDWIGRAGLEALYDTQLRGEDGYRLFLSGRYEESLIEKPPRDGEDLQLSLDAMMQRMLYDELAHEKITVSVLNPQNGEVLALVSTPGYDPMAFVLGIKTEAYQALLDDPRKPLVADFAMNLTPGSTQKLLTAWIALDKLKLGHEETMDIVGKTWQPSKAWGGYEVTRYLEVDGPSTLAEALTRSDNIYFARLALEMGAEAFVDGMEALGFGQAVMTEYPFPVSQVSKHALQDGSVLLADTGYGQGELRMPPLHLAALYGALQAEGVVYRPHLLLHKTPPVPWLKAVLPEKDLLYLREALREVSLRMYPKQLDRPMLEIIGKSGTTELGTSDEDGPRLNNWFVGFDARNPRLCMVLTHLDSHEVPELYYGIRRFGDLFTLLLQPWRYEGQRPPRGPVVAPLDIPEAPERAPQPPVPKNEPREDLPF